MFISKAMKRMEIIMEGFEAAKIDNSDFISNVECPYHWNSDKFDWWQQGYDFYQETKDENY